MNNWKINKTVDLTRGIDGIEVWPHALLVTGDENAHEWDVTVMDNGKPASLSGTIRAYFVRSDGATVTATGSVSKNIATVTLPEACYAYEGDLQAVMQLIGEDVTVTLSALLLRVRQISTDVIIDPGEEIPSLDDLLAQIEKIKQATKDANAATSKANTAATNADAATSKANASATKADTATSNANTATERANAAAKAAEGVVADAATKEYVGEQVDNIEIGGRNYARNTEYKISKKIDGTDSASSIIICYRPPIAKAGDFVTISCVVQLRDIVLGDGDTHSINIQGRGYPNGTTQESDAYALSESRSNIVSGSFYFRDILPGDSLIRIRATIALTESQASQQYWDTTVHAKNIESGTYTVSDFMFEYGNKVTDWSPAPEDFEIGSRNLLLNSNEFISSTGYNVKNYSLAVTPVVGERYTISIKGELGEGKTGFSVYNTGGNVTLLDDLIGPDANGVYKGTFIWKNTQSSGASVVPKYVSIFAKPNVQNVTSTIEWVKLEKGSKATDWTPAPEDVNAKIDGIFTSSANLLSDTRDFGGTWNNHESFTTEGTYMGLTVKSTTGRFIGISKIITVQAGTYTFSANVRGTEGEVFQLYIPNANSEVPEIQPSYKFFTMEDGSWHRYSTTFTVSKDMELMPRVEKRTNSSNKIYACGYKLEKGSVATGWSPALEDSDFRRAGITYDYGGRNLKEVFGTAEALHTALTAEDYSNIAVGDYWPITLNGSFRDYGSYSSNPDTKYYSDPDLTNEVNTAHQVFECTYYSDKAVKIVGLDVDRYMSINDCQPYYERACNNVTVNLEVAGINHYWRYGESGDFTGKKPHIVFVSRDCLPFLMRMRKGPTHWENTEINNPWLGSALYRTFNDPDHGIIALLEQTELAPYINAGSNGKGMNAILEIKAPDAANATGWAWHDRGKLFLPSVAEVWGHPFWSEMNWEGGLGNQYAIFRDSRRHISKGAGDSGSRCDWWLGSSCAGSAANFAFVNNKCFADRYSAANAFAVPLCFVFA